MTGMRQRLGRMDSGVLLEIVQTWYAADGYAFGSRVQLAEVKKRLEFVREKVGRDRRTDALLEHLDVLSAQLDEFDGQVHHATVEWEHRVREIRNRKEDG